MTTHLGKWPAMVVIGKKVTEVQAREIIVRTSGLRFTSNNHKFSQALYEHVFKKKLPDQVYHCTVGDFFDDIEEYHDAIRRYGILDLEYLKNSRIVSSYIGGPHGWCNWDGSIFTNSYNIGKWPSEDEVVEEWTTIAETFPYLDLKCQLWSKEVCEEDNTPVVQYDVKHGKVTKCRPEDLYVYPGSGEISSAQFVAMLMSPEKSSYECGCTLEEAIAALDYVEELMSR